jgi:hypothetical protein
MRSRIAGRLAAVATFALATAVATSSGHLSILPTASASVSIAVSVEALVARSSAVAVVTAQEERTAYEGGRIFTYTRAHVDRPIAGEIATGADIWVRSEGGIVDHVGMHVDGEPNLEVGKTSLVFLTPGTPGIYEVTARGQGQFPIVADAAHANAFRVHRNASAGTLLPPKSSAAEARAKTSSVAGNTTSPNVRLAAEALHDRPVDDVAKDIADTWKRVRGS